MTPPDIRQISNDANYWQREANYWRNRYADALSRLDAAERTAVDYRKQVDQIAQACAAAYRLIEELTSDRDSLLDQLRNKPGINVNLSPPVQYITEDQLLSMLGFPRSNE